MLFFIEFIGVTVVNKTIQVSHVQLNKTSHFVSRSVHTQVAFSLDQLPLWGNVSLLRHELVEFGKKFLGVFACSHDILKGCNHVEALLWVEIFWDHGTSLTSFRSYRSGGPIFCFLIRQAY